MRFSFLVILVYGAIYYVRIEISHPNEISSFQLLG